MDFGTASVVITPPVGTWLQGFGSRDHASEGVLDNLTAQVAVFRSDGVLAAIVSADLLGFPAELVQRLQAAVHREIGAAPDSVMLVATHTHAGPAVADVRAMGSVDSGYLDFLESNILSAARAARDSLSPVELGIGSVDGAGGSVVREGPGTSKDPVDPEMKVLVAYASGTKRPVGMFVNYACHPVVLGGGNYRISADFPGRLRRHCLARTSVDPIFVQGACGDLNPPGMYLHRPSQRPLTIDDMHSLGDRLGEKAVEAAEKAHVETETGRRGAERIAYGATSIDIPTKVPEPELLKRLSVVEPAENATEARISQVRATWASEMSSKVREGTYPGSVSVPVHVLRIDDVVFAGIGAELFSDLGAAIKQELTPSRTFIAGYVNGCVGYIASEAAYDSSPYAALDSCFWYGSPVLARNAGTVLVEGIAEYAREVLT